MAGKFAGLQLEEAAARMTVIHPIELTPLLDRDGNECWVELLPAEGKQGALIDRKASDKLLRRRVQRMTAKDIEENTIAKLAGLTKNWKLALLDGTPLPVPCTEENAVEVYTEVRWLRNQVATFANDLGNFQTTSSETSAISPNITSG
jgi:hypothetical protein